MKPIQMLGYFLRNELFTELQNICFCFAMFRSVLCYLFYQMFGVYQRNRLNEVETVKNFKFCVLRMCYEIYKDIKRGTYSYLHDRKIKFKKHKNLL